MKILSDKLKSVIITALVILAVVLGMFFTASTLSDAVSAEARMIPNLQFWYAWKQGCGDF